MSKNTSSKTVTYEERIKSFKALPKPDFNGDVTIFWDDHLVPFIKAEDDEDAAFALGMVQAHLRLGQMEVGKRLATGRISEMAGSLANDMDEAIRILGFANAAEGTLARMPKSSQIWCQKFCDGINFYKAHMTQPPKEYKWLGMDPKEDWTIKDSIAIGRLGGTDANWHWMLPLLRMRQADNWEEIWQKTLQIRGISAPSFAPISRKSGRRLQSLGGIFIATGRNGSNSFAVGPEKSATGAPIIANDPHLGFLTPNVWVLAGIQSPSYHVVGAMPIGTPSFAFGRTPHIAWGGTNLRSLNSDLVDIADIKESDITSEKHKIKTRFFFDKTVNIRQTPYGPVISDAKIFPSMKGQKFALKWSGHLPSDEITALLRGMKSETVEQFRACFDQFAIPPQNFICVDKSGNIGHILATWLPKRPVEHPDDICIKPETVEETWSNILRSDDLPAVINPEDGFVASANNRPVQHDAFSIGWFFSSYERISRIKYLLHEKDNFTVDDMINLQHDTYSITAIELKNKVQAMARKMDLTTAQSTVLENIQGWDGYYDMSSKGAIIFESFIEHFCEHYFIQQDRKDDYDLWKRGRFLKIALADELHNREFNDVAPSITYALDKAKVVMDSSKTWGDIHHISLSHFLSNVPFFKYFLDKKRFPTGGSSETVWKSAHDITTDDHDSFYGSQARHISDMSDPNENYFVILGGQDGFLGSQNFFDQTELWINRDYVRFPLEVDAIERQFSHVVEFKTTRQTGGEQDT